MEGWISKTICAFANSEGGSLYGLDDDAVVLGVENMKTNRNTSK